MGQLQSAVDARYAGWEGELGQSIGEGKQSLDDLWQRVHAGDHEPAPVSGRQELLENRVRAGIERALR